MTKQRVQLWGKPQGYAVVDTEATNGAVLGVNIRLPDGTMATKEDFAPPVPDVERLQQTVLVNIKEQTRLLVEEQQARDQAVADALLQAASEAQEKVDAAKALIDAEVDGLQAQLNDFAGQADDWSDQVDYPSGDYVKSGGKLYRALQDVPAGTPLTDTAYWQQLGNYASAGEAISAALVMSTQNASDISAESQRVDTLFTGLGDANAEINTLQQAQSDTEQSLADFVTQTQASFGGVEAQIIAANQARADGDSVNALAIQGVEAGLAGKADVSVVQTMEAYSTATNLVPNSAFSNGADGTSFSASGGSWSGVIWNLAAPDWLMLGVNNIGIVGFGVVPSNVIADIFVAKVPVEQNERYGFSCRLAAHRGNNQMFILFHDASGSAVGPPVFSALNASFVGGPQRNSWMLAEVIEIAPPGAVSASVYVRTHGRGESDVYSWLCQPMAVKIAPTSTRVPVYSVGGREMAARHTVLLDVGGNISGTVSENDGKRSVFSVLADVFRVIASGSVGMEILSRAGGYFMRFYAGAAQIILGINFGQNNNLCLWYGPNVGEANANKSNATVWFDNAGSAYFGGSLSAGVLWTDESRNINTLQPGPDSRLDIVHRNSTGKTKACIFSAIFGNGQGFASFPTLADANNWRANNPDHSGTINLRLRRGTTTLWTGTVSYAFTTEPVEREDTTPPQWLVPYYDGGGVSGTLTDPYTTGGDVPYTLEVTGHSGTVSSKGLLSLRVQEE